MARNRAQVGFLIALLLFLLLGLLAEYTGKHDRPGDDEGGGPIAVLGILGFILLFLVFATVGVVRVVTNKIHGKAQRPKAGSE